MAAAAVAALVAFESGDLAGMGIRSAMGGRGSLIAMLRVEVVIHAAMEVRGGVGPVTGADEVTASKPLGAIVTVWCAVIGSVVVLAVWARRFGAKVDADRHLSRSGGGRDYCNKSCGSQTGKNKLDRTHWEISSCG